MSGRLDFDPTPQSLNRAKPLVGVFRYFGPGEYEFLPNVVAETIQERFGDSPSVCSFRFTSDGYNQSGYPIRIEDVMPLSATGQSVVKNDDELVVVTFDPLGNRRFLFHGFAKIPQADLSASQERLTFQAIGVEEREWDTPLGGGYVLDADDPDSTGVGEKSSGLPARFNPDGMPNATKSGADQSNNGFKYSVFIDPLSSNLNLGRKWTLSMAARYILGRGNRDEQFVKLPPWEDVENLLVAWAPVDGQTIDPTDPATFNEAPILLRDQVVTGKTWPEALDGLIRPHGFGMRFELETDSDGDPVTRLVLWRRDAGDQKRYKDLFLPKPGNDLDVGKANLGAAQIARDGSQIANEITVETGLTHYEGSFVLAPGFKIEAGDAANKKSFRRTSPTYPQNSDKYRTYVFDDVGSGHWVLADGTWTSGTGTDLTKVLGGLVQDAKLWVKRRRPGRMTLLSKDSNGQAHRAVLAISFDYAGASPGVWDGTGTWRPVKAEWSLLKDQLGIHLDCEDPNAVHVGSVGAETGRKATKVVRGVEFLTSNPQTKFALRLTTVIEGDQRTDASAPRRPASPTRFVISQSVDAQDKYKLENVSMWSEFSTTPGWQPDPADLLVRDDTASAQADAESRRSAQEIPHLAGSVTIPRLTLAYKIGDRLKKVRGREINLQTNASAGGREAPAYAEVVGRNFALGSEHATTLLVSDRRMDFAL